ncbi:ArsR/SmtB family transcription factor [Synechococcus elongatus]|uniref:Metalloregulator ArsR/SmtB family transcription factor n=1 Tax=Synechococcus elongatus PCC 11801 TaxID=2219813 RepID=A0AAN1QQM4_SYNEL|nr:metalloregulator ArsR/SmtB family transcription factor [Synechococcus elongatus]
MSSPGTAELETSSTSPDLDRLAELFKVLGDRSRLGILWRICQGECNVTEISESTGLSQANVSKHLQMLRMARLVACRKEGNARIYFLSDPQYSGLCARSLIDLASLSPVEVSSCDEARA